MYILIFLIKYIYIKVVVIGTAFSSALCCQSRAGNTDRVRVTTRNVAFLIVYLINNYLYAYLVSRLLRGVVSSSLCFRKLRRPYQGFVSSTDLDPAAVLVPVAYFVTKYLGPP